MANEAKITRLTAVTASSQSTASTLAAAAVSPSSATVTLLSSSNHSNYPLADAVLTFSATASVSSASNTINLYRRDMNHDSGTADDPELSINTTTGYMQKYVGSFVVGHTSAAATQSSQVTDVLLSDQCEFYIENKLNGGITDWTLKIIPKTFVPG